VVSPPIADAGIILIEATAFATDDVEGRPGESPQSPAHTATAQRMLSDARKVASLLVPGESPAIRLNRCRYTRTMA
jgi:hypothetical protein